MTFDDAVEFILQMEGGFSDHPDDPGAATNWGISSRAHNLTVEEVKNLTRDDAKRIYLEKYWKPLGCEKLPAPMDLIVLDSGVQHGNPRAKRWLDEVGEKPFAYLAKRMRFYTSLRETWPTFGRGWMNRVAHLLQAAGKAEPLDDLALVQIFDDDYQLDFDVEKRTLGRTLEGFGKLMVRVPPSSFLFRLRYLFRRD